MKAQVLVVDDSLTVRVDLQDVFEAAGFATTPCASIKDARTALARAVYQLIVLDVLLPDADGIDFLKEIKAAAATREIPVMILSAETDVKDRVRGLSIGAVEYIGKPYDRSYVIARASELLCPGETNRAVARTAPMVLVIDDSPTSREALKSTLGASGFHVLLAETGEEGLRLAARLRPNAILVDGKLPGIDGPTVVRRLRADAALRTMPCMLVTDSSDHDDEFIALEAGADSYVRKGEDKAVLLARLMAILRSSKVGAAVSAAGQEKSLLDPKRVLTIDDSPTYLNALALPLREDGYEVIMAPSGEQALELLVVQPVDGILLDLTMPGLSGQETCRRIKASALWRDIPLLMLTAREDPAAMLESFSAGADDYIAKSNEFVILRARLRAQLRRKQFEDENHHIRERLARKEVEVVEARATRELAETRGKLLLELENANAELEAFSYSVSHDLRAPLRSIDGFSQILLQDYGAKLDDAGKKHIERVHAACQRMNRLIEDLLKLSKLSRSAMTLTEVDLSALARAIAASLRAAQPERAVEFVIEDGLKAAGDEGLLRIVLENLIGNAWKFTSKTKSARIECGVAKKEGAAAGKSHFVIRDNGAGFDAAHAKKLFAPFQRLHSPSEFEGTGIGLATVRRIMQRHGGSIWAEGVAGQGASFYFSI